MKTVFYISLFCLTAVVVTSQRCTGGPHDKLNNCGTRCPLTCDQPNERPCTRECVIDVCQCEQGYVRDSNSQCIRPQDCPNKNRK